MRVVLDTNILLVSISSRSLYHLIFKSFVERKYELCITTDILNEYAEIISKYSGEKLANLALEVIDNAENTVFITRYFAFNLIFADPDDNKFVDCAIASNADFIVTNDKHFDVLKELPYPHLNVIAINEFIDILESL